MAGVATAAARIQRWAAVTVVAAELAAWAERGIPQGRSPWRRMLPHPCTALVISFWTTALHATAQDERRVADAPLRG